MNRKYMVQPVASNRFENWLVEFPERSLPKIARAGRFRRSRLESLRGSLNPMAFLCEHGSKEASDGE